MHKYENSRQARIPGGATLWARKTLESDIFNNKPHVWFKIFFYLVNRAHFEKTRHFDRGECYLKYEWIEAATKATKGEIDHFLRWAKSATQNINGKATQKNPEIATRKATHGMIVKVLNYDLYQTLDNYYSDMKSDTEIDSKSETENDSKSDTKATQKRHRSDNILKNVKNAKEHKNRYETASARQPIAYGDSQPLEAGDSAAAGITSSPDLVSHRQQATGIRLGEILPEKTSGSAAEVLTRAQLAKGFDVLQNDPKSNFFKHIYEDEVAEVTLDEVFAPAPEPTKAVEPGPVEEVEEEVEPTLSEKTKAMREKLIKKLDIIGFSDTEKYIGAYCKNLVNLEEQIGSQDFWLRFETLRADEYHRPKLSKPKYLYEQMRGLSSSALNWSAEWYKIHLLTFGAYADIPASQYHEDLAARGQRYRLFEDQRALADLHMDMYLNQSYLEQFCYKPSAIKEAVEKILVPEGVVLSDHENIAAVYFGEASLKTPLIFRKSKNNLIHESWAEYLTPEQVKTLAQKNFQFFSSTDHPQPVNNS